MDTKLKLDYFFTIEAFIKPRKVLQNVYRLLHENAKSGTSINA